MSQMYKKKIMTRSCCDENYHLAMSLVTHWCVSSTDTVGAGRSPFGYRPTAIAAIRHGILGFNLEVILRLA